MGGGLLQALVGVSEKAAGIARLCRREEPLFQLLVAEKTGPDKNRRFLQDFKTLADVLIQEVIKHDLGKEFPELQGHIHGEESNEFRNTHGRAMAVEGGIKCVKFLVFIFNFIFWVCGVALVAIGIYAQVALNKTLAFSSSSAASSPVAIMVLGVIIFFISFFGCCGAWKESYCMVTMFAILLGIVFLVEIAAAITGFVFKDKVHSLLEEGLQNALERYGQDQPLTKAMDDLQREFTCCGVKNYTDWDTVEQFKVNNTLPRSCCRGNSSSCSPRLGPNIVYEEGCLQSTEAWLRSNILIVAAIPLGIAFFEILGIIFACCLMRGIRSGYEVM
ncbi:CD63 antigen isoform X2 [Heliangelus exortis]|uniref:CD63 antigen isoform X2 n=1 Tax=Heliangelus exortis TaxID=472823 RepID=UPI003A8F4800